MRAGGPAIIGNADDHPAATSAGQPAQFSDLAQAPMQWAMFHDHASGPEAKIKPAC
jgi:hypothetical protein